MWQIMASRIWGSLSTLRWRINVSYHCCERLLAWLLGLVSATKSRPLIAQLIFSTAQEFSLLHYNYVTMSAMASQITGISSVFSSVFSGAYQWKHQSSAQDFSLLHYNYVTMSTMAFQITGISPACSSVFSGAYQWKHQRSASLVFVRGIHRGLMHSPHISSYTHLPWTKWTSFRRRRFEIHFYEWQVLYFD